MSLVDLQIIYITLNIFIAINNCEIRTWDGNCLFVFNYLVSYLKVNSNGRILVSLGVALTISSYANECDYYKVLLVKIVVIEI